MWIGETMRVIHSIMDGQLDVRLTEPPLSSGEDTGRRRFMYDRTVSPDVAGRTIEPSLLRALSHLLEAAPDVQQVRIESFPDQYYLRILFRRGYMSGDPVGRVIELVNALLTYFGQPTIGNKAQLMVYELKRSPEARVKNAEALRTVLSYVLLCLTELLNTRYLADGEG